MGEPRNPRVDTLMNPQGQTSATASAFDIASPLSVDFSFPFAGSPHGSSNSGIDAPPDLRMGPSQGFPARSSISDIARLNTPKLASQQHRASLTSIDSAFDQDLIGNTGVSQWVPSGSSNQALSLSEGSPRRLGNGNDQDRKLEDDEKPPAWSELKTKAGKERKRLPLACIACRRKKIRCSGEKPACKHCLRARVPCVYKVTTRKAAPRTDYMAMLDKRLKRMEDRVIRVIPKEELPDLSITGRSAVRPPLPGQTPKKEKVVPTKKRSADEAFTQELSDWTQSRQSQGLLDPSAGLRKQKDGENKLFIEGSETLPPQHIQEHLAEVFFDCLYGQSYLLLHKPSFMRKLKAGTVPPVLILAVCAISARFSTHPLVSTEPAFLRGEQWATPARRIVEKRHYEPNITILTVMLILGLHYFGTCEGGLSWSFGGQAMRMGYALQLHRELDKDPLGRNQLAGKSSDPTKPSVKPPELSFTDREIRRRTMWACYLMDTFNSSGTERPSFLNEDYFQIQLPIKESHFQMEVPGPTEDLHGNVPSSHNNSKSSSLDTTATVALAAEAKSNMGVAAYVVRAVVLWKRIVKYLNLGGKDSDPHPIWNPLSQFAGLQRQITALKTTLPSHLAYTPENLATHLSVHLANQFIFLHIVLSQTSLFLHRFAIPTHPTSRPHHHTYLSSGMPKTFLSSSANNVISSAEAISHLIADSTGHTLTVPFAGYCAYAAATVHVWGIFSKNSALENTSKENLRHNYKYLTRMKRYWGMFHYMAESVKDIYRAFADAALRYSQAGGAGGLTASSAASLLRQASSGPGALVDSGAQTPLDLSRSGTPAQVSSANPGGLSTGPDGRGSTDTKPPGTSHSQSTSAGSTRAMFQYGDWFDKYPHGVSEVEWESSHLEFKKEGEKGSEAVMSQRSDLKSVEEFFASLSPPSKAEEMQGNGRGRKVARRRGKSVAENTAKKGGSGGGASGAGPGPMDLSEQIQQQEQGQSRHAQTSQAQSQSQSQPQANQQQQPARRQSQMSSGRPQIQRHMSGTSTHPADLSLGLNTQQAYFNPSDFDITSPSIYQTPTFGNQPNRASFDYGVTPPTAQFHFPNYASVLPHLDRQMVFGAYAGIDPSTNPSTTGILNNLGNNNNNSAHPQSSSVHPNQQGQTQPQPQFDVVNSPSASAGTGTNNPWDALDNLAYGSGFGDAFYPGSSYSGVAGSGGMGSTAWFMPFNIEPPNFGGAGALGGEMEEFNGTALDGMDLGDLISGPSTGAGGGNDGSSDIGPG